MMLWDHLHQAGMECAGGWKRLIVWVRGVEKKATDSVLSQRLRCFEVDLLLLQAEMALLQMNEMLGDLLKQRFH